MDGERFERWCGRAAAEVVLVLAIFAAAGAWPTPDVNEAHYLTKARHFVDPSWCAGDFFLETAEAHGIFFRMIGPLTAAMPLAEAAWVGRVLGWLALAVGFCHAVWPLLPGTGARVLAAAIFSLALRNTTAAGEWLIGGCEAKVFAWAFLLGATGEIARGRFASAWLSAGAATALHVVVGGWGMVAVMLQGIVAAVFPSGACRTESANRLSAAMLSGRVLSAAMLLAGAALAALGVVPALRLSANVSAADRSAAAVIYVVERLSHHLLPRTFADGMVARHVLAILLWLVLSRTTLSRAEGGAAGERVAARRRVDGFTAAAIAISLAGWAISLLEPVAPGVAYALLRFYWFRLADGLVPLALAVAAAAVLCGDGVRAGPLPWRAGLVRAIVVAVLCGDLVNESRHWPLPWRTDLAARSDAKMLAGPWRDICDWVRDNAPADACFLTPRGAVNFTWRTGRREAVSWKNMPQDPRSLVEWRARIVDCFSRNGSLTALEATTAALGPERMRLAAARCGADHAIVPLDAPGVADLPWPRLHANDGYAVLRLTADPVETR